MKKIVLLFSVFIIVSFCSIAQFPIYFNSTNSESIGAIVENKIGNIATLVLTEGGTPGNMSIHVYGSDGEVLSSHTYPTSDEVYQIYGNLFEVNDFYFVVGYI